MPSSSPLIVSYSFDKNPVVVGEEVELSILVIDVVGVEGPEEKVSNEFYSGEV